MAFQLANYKDPSTGAMVSYWVMRQLVLDPVRNSLLVTVNGYVDAEAFAGNLDPVASEQFPIPDDVYQQFLAGMTTADLPIGTEQAALLAELLGALAQNMLTLPFFEGGTIVA